MAFLGWLLIVSSIAISALLFVPLRLAKPDGLSQLWSSGRGGNRDGRSGTKPLVEAGAVFLIIVGIGAAVSLVRDLPQAIGSERANSDPRPPGNADDEMLAQLNEYATSIEGEKPASKPASEMLPDVNTMIERLAARLMTTPNDLQGWRMLGWSYFNMQRYDDAATAYAKAVELDPNSADLKRAYDEAKAKASGSESLNTGSISPPHPAGKAGDAPHAGAVARAEGTAPHEGNAAIRAMVDGLASRLDASPRDVEGWTRLMRSRVVLGEREAATTALRKALDVFKDDSVASGQIAAAATELGLKVE
jgi:cytochrome c-type biogenesis protein CcmH/NrfG